MNTRLEIELPVEIPFTEIKALGVFGDVFRFEIRDEANRDHIHFKKEHFTSNKEEAVLELKRELDERELFLVKVMKGIILTGNEPSEMIPESWYIVYAQKYPTIDLADLPF
jgi:hypothetical protein